MIETEKRKPNAGRRVVWAALTLLWCLVIFRFSATPSVESSEQSGFMVRLILAAADALGLEGALGIIPLDLLEHIVRKLAHFTVYFVLGLLAFQTAWAYAGGRAPLREDSAEQARFGLRGCMWAAVLFCGLYAASDEFHQYFVPGRAAMWQDVCLDTAASFVACALSRAVCTWHK